MKHKALFLTLLAILAMQTALSGCNTVRGAGQDIEALGDNIEDEAEEKKTY